MKRRFPIPVVVIACLALSASAGAAFGHASGGEGTFIPEEGIVSCPPAHREFGFFLTDVPVDPVFWLLASGSLAFLAAAALHARGREGAAHRVGLLSIVLLAHAVLLGCVALFVPLGMGPEMPVAGNTVASAVILLGTWFVFGRMWTRPRLPPAGKGRVRARPGSAGGRA